MRYNLECLETAGISVENLRAVGGGSKSDLWMQIKVDITSKKVESGRGMC
jgi:xylulokinase